MSFLGVPSHWRRYKERYRLMGSRCLNCGSIFFPPTKVCPKCRREGKLEDLEFSGKGKVHSFTVIRFAPEGFTEYAPYAIGLIKLNEGPSVISQIVDCDFEDIHIDMPVEACFRKLMAQGKDGIICYGFKFRPANDSWKKP
jgi:hypothetical protein